MSSNESNPGTSLSAPAAADAAEAMEVTTRPENDEDASKTEAQQKATSASSSEEELPSNRFELELEFVQALASPNYLHFLATTTTTAAEGGGGNSSSSSMTVLQDPVFIDFLKYLRQTWTQPTYARFLSYPHCLYFLELLIEKPAVMRKEWTLPQFRNFCHQQQFLCWQHRHATCYGRGTTQVEAAASLATPAATDSSSVDGQATSPGTSS